MFSSFHGTVYKDYIPNGGGTIVITFGEPPKGVHFVVISGITDPGGVGFVVTSGEAVPSVGVFEVIFDETAIGRVVCVVSGVAVNQVH